MRLKPVCRYRVVRHLRLVNELSSDEQDEHDEEQNPEARFPPAGFLLPAGGLLLDCICFMSSNGLRVAVFIMRQHQFLCAVADDLF